MTAFLQIFFQDTLPLSQHRSFASVHSHMNHRHWCGIWMSQKISFALLFSFGKGWLVTFDREDACQKESGIMRRHFLTTVLTRGMFARVSTKTKVIDRLLPQTSECSHSTKPRTAAKQKNPNFCSQKTYDGGRKTEHGRGPACCLPIPRTTIQLAVEQHKDVDSQKMEAIWSDKAARPIHVWGFRQGEAMARFPAFFCFCFLNLKIVRPDFKYWMEWKIRVVLLRVQ